MDDNSRSNSLRIKLEDKKQEILKLVAGSYGLGDVGSLDPEKLEQLHDEVEDIIDEHNEAVSEGDTLDEWHALDERLAPTEIGRLLQESHEIAEQILNLLEDDAGLGEDE